MLRAARERVLERIHEACLRRGRDPATVELLPVSKSVEPSTLVAAMAAGMDVFGESRVQEAEPKQAFVTGARWQLVGHLQANKAARAVAAFEGFHALDSLDLARRLDRLVRAAGSERRLAVYLQVNIDDDPAKSGFSSDGVTEALPDLAGMAGLELRGLMSVGRQVARADEARTTFVRLRSLAERLRPANPSLGPGLSMGMSDDFEVAVEEGSTVVRIGRLIFGERPAA